MIFLLQKSPYLFNWLWCIWKKMDLKTKGMRDKDLKNLPLALVICFLLLEINFLSVFFFPKTSFPFIKIGCNEFIPMIIQKDKVIKLYL